MPPHPAILDDGSNHQQEAAVSAQRSGQDYPTGRCRLVRTRLVFPGLNISCGHLKVEQKSGTSPEKKLINLTYFQYNFMRLLNDCWFQ